MQKFNMQDSNPSKTSTEKNLELVEATEFQQPVVEKLYKTSVKFILSKQSKLSQI